jgi:hypothetical protein
MSCAWRWNNTRGRRRHRWICFAAGPPSLPPRIPNWSSPAGQQQVDSIGHALAREQHYASDLHPL